jgi:hypothetical protein
LKDGFGGPGGFGGGGGGGYAVGAGGGGGGGGISGGGGGAGDGGGGGGGSFFQGNVPNVLTITLSGGGTLADGAGYSGLTDTNTPGVYTLSGDAASISAELDALVFTPAKGAPGASATTTFTLSDLSSDYAVAAVDSTVSVTNTDPGPPTVSSITAVNALTNNGAADQFTVIFSEAVTGVSNNDFTLTTTNTPGGAALTTGGISTITGGGTTYTVTVGNVAGDGTLRLDFNANSAGVTDAAGNGAVAGFSSGDTYTIEHTPPAVTSITALDALTNNSSTESYDVTFSENVTGVNASDFEVTLGGSASCSTPLKVTPVSGDEYEVDLSGVTGNGTLQLAFNSGPADVADAAGNVATADFTSGDTYTVDHTPPTVSSITATGSSPNNVSSDSFTVTFSESVTGVDKSDFTTATTGTVGDTGMTVTPVGGGVYTVTVDGVTGDGTLGLNLNSSGTGIADAAGNAISGGFNGQVYMIDHTRPSVAFNATPTSFDGTHATVLAGTTADGGSGLASVKIYEGAVRPADLLGAASIAGATWSLSMMLASPGVYNALKVVATDKAGNTTIAAAPFTLQTGLTRRPYAALENIYTSGVVSAQKFFNGDGSIYLAGTVASDGHGGLDYTYTSGSYFTGKHYVSYENHFNSSGALIARTYFTGNGSVYIFDTIASDGHGGLDFTSSHGSYFTGKPYTSLEGDFTSGGKLIASTFFNGNGSVYLAETSTPDGHGGLDYTYSSGSYFIGKPYASFENHVNSSGALTSQTSFNRNGSVYLGDTVASDGHGGLDYTYSSGSYFTGKPYASFESDVNSSGSLAERTFHNRDGSQQIEGFVTGLTLTGGQGDTTFVFEGAFGAEIVGDLLSHLTGKTHDTISIPSFATFNALLAATHDNGQGNAVITVSPGNTATLLGVDKATMMSNPLDFHTA